MSVRGAALCSRFVLTAYLARYLDLKTVGLFGLISGVIAIAPSFLGMGLNFPLGREIITLPILSSACKIRDRLAVQTVMILACTFCVLVLERFHLLPIPIPSKGLLLMVVGLEVLAFDIHLALISLRMPEFSNVFLLFKNGLWIYPLVLMGVLFPNYRTVETVLQFWFAGLLLAFALLAFRLWRWPWRAIVRQPIDFDWIFARIRSSVLVYFSDIGNVTFQYLDRFVIGYTLGVYAAGVYTFYWPIANAIQVLVTASFVQTALPKYVDNFEANGFRALNGSLAQDLRKVFFVGVVMCFLAYFAVMAALPYLKKPGLQEHTFLLPLLLLASVVRIASDLASYGLYAAGLNKLWAWSNMIGFAISSITIVAFIHFFSIMGAAFAAVLSALILMLGRGAVLQHCASQTQIDPRSLSNPSYS